MEALLPWSSLAPARSRSGIVVGGQGPSPSRTHGSLTEAPRWSLSTEEHPSGARPDPRLMVNGQGRGVAGVVPAVGPRVARSSAGLKLKPRHTGRVNVENACSSACCTVTFRVGAPAGARGGRVARGTRRRGPDAGHRDLVPVNGDEPARAGDQTSRGRTGQQDVGKVNAEDEQRTQGLMISPTCVGECNEERA